MECKKEKNTSKCNCTYEPCSRKGICCDCISYHLGNGEVPACFFLPTLKKHMTEAWRDLSRQVESARDRKEQGRRI